MTGWDEIQGVRRGVRIMWRSCLLDSPPKARSALSYGGLAGRQA